MIYLTCYIDSLKYMNEWPNTIDTMKDWDSLYWSGKHWYIEPTWEIYWSGPLWSDEPLPF